MFRASIIWFFVLVVPANMAFAQTDFEAKKTEYTKWNIRLSPYFWFINIQGDSEDPPDPTEPGTPPPSNLPETPERFDIDLSFQELRTSIKFALLLSGEYRKGRLSGVFDVTSFVLEGGVITPFDVVFQDVQYRFGFTFAEASGGYDLINKEKFLLTGLVGLRLIYFEIGGSTRILGKWEFGGLKSNTWLDPTFGLKFKYVPHFRTEFVAYGDIGPFNPSTNVGYQYAFTFNFLFAKRFYSSLGWREMNLKSAREFAVYNGRVFGPFVKIGVQFL